MANPEHLAILKQGVELWNQWREEKPGVLPDLEGANIEEAILRGANLNKANMREANLCNANLSHANLYEADLRRANLRKVELEETDLTRADLSGADFVLANIKHAEFFLANLYGVDFIESNITRAKFHLSNFDKAIFGFTVLSNVLFKETKCLDTTIHKGPSTLGIDTLYNSKGNIPEVFLRGCGVPDQMIEYAESLTGSSIEYYSCFISYSHKDEGFAKRLWEGLQAKNVRCWYAPHDMKIGAKIRPTIDDSIRIHDKLLLILSEHSVESDWVEHEVEHALDIEKEKKKNVLFPVRVDEAVMESKTGWASNVRRQRHIGDFTNWKDHDAYSKAFERLLRDLKAGVRQL